MRQQDIHLLKSLMLLLKKHQIVFTFHNNVLPGLLGKIARLVGWARPFWMHINHILKVLQRSCHSIASGSSSPEQGMQVWAYCPANQVSDIILQLKKIVCASPALHNTHPLLSMLLWRTEGPSNIICSAVFHMYPGPASLLCTLRASACTQHSLARGHIAGSLYSLSCYQSYKTLANPCELAWNEPRLEFGTDVIKLIAQVRQGVVHDLAGTLLALRLHLDQDMIVQRVRELVSSKGHLLITEQLPGPKGTTPTIRSC